MLDTIGFILIMGLILSKVEYEDESQLVRVEYWNIIPLCFY